MHRRLMALLLVLGVASVAALGTLYAERIDLSHEADDADHLTLYQNGLAAIRLVRDFEAPGGDVVLGFQLPTTTIFDSVAVRGEGVTIKEIRSSLQANPTLMVGDFLVIHVRDGPVVEGTLLQEPTHQLLVSSDEGTTVVGYDDVVAVEVRGRVVDPAEVRTTDVTVLVSAPAGARQVEMSYLAQGAGWNPSHILDPSSGEMTFFATLTGLQDWEGVGLSLVAGNPNMVYTPYRDGPRMAFSMAGASLDANHAEGDGGYETFSPSTDLGDLHKYEYPGTLTFRQGETVRLPVATGTVAVVRHYYEASARPHESGSWGGLPERYQIRNTLTEPLPAGPVRMYIDGGFIGADSMQALGVGEVGNVTAARSADVKARTVLVDQQRGAIQVDIENNNYRREYRVVTSTYDFQVRNLKGHAVDMRAVFDPSGYDQLGSSANPAPGHMEGTRMVWDKTLTPGETATFRITLQNREYI